MPLRLAEIGYLPACLQRPFHISVQGAVPGNFPQSRPDGLQRVVRHKSRGNRRRKEHLPINAVAPMAEIRIPIGKRRRQPGITRRRVGEPVGPDIRADPLAEGIVPVRRLRRWNARLQVAQRHILRRAGAGKPFDPHPPHVRRGEIEAVGLQNQQTQQGIGDVVVHRHPVHAVPGVSLSRVHPVLHVPGTIHLPPIFLRREGHAAGRGQRLHAFHRPIFYRYPQCTAGEPAQHRPGHPILEPFRPLRRVAPIAQGENGGVRIRLPFPQQRVGIQSANSCLRLPQRLLQPVRRCLRLSASAGLRRQRGEIRRPVQPLPQRAKIHIMHSRFLLYKSE